VKKLNQEIEYMFNLINNPVKTRIINGTKEIWEKNYQKMGKHLKNSNHMLMQKQINAHNKDKKLKINNNNITKLNRTEI